MLKNKLVQQKKKCDPRQFEDNCTFNHTFLVLRVCLIMLILQFIISYIYNVWVITNAILHFTLQCQKHKTGIQFYALALILKYSKFTYKFQQTLCELHRNFYKFNHVTEQFTELSTSVCLLCCLLHQDSITTLNKSRKVDILQRLEGRLQTGKF